MYTQFNTQINTLFTIGGVMANPVYNFEQTRTDVLKVALRELIKRKSQPNIININVKFDNRSISILNAK